MVGQDVKKWQCDYNRRYRKVCPWLRAYTNAHARCNNKHHSHYVSYGRKGIKLQMKPSDFKFLWFRDKAYLMKRPSIDRIDPRKNYTVANCRYLEYEENSKRRLVAKTKRVRRRT